MSATPESTAESGSKRRRVVRAMIAASVVLPAPGGPQSTSEGVSSRSIMPRSGLPGPTTSSWPDEVIEGRRAHPRREWCGPRSGSDGAARQARLIPLEQVGLEAGRKAARTAAAHTPV